jgi:hypothetical protein
MLDGPADLAGGGARDRYVAALMQHGAGFYVDGADVDVKALRVGETMVPVVVNHGRSRTSEVWSPYAHFCLYTAEEWAKRHRWSPRAGLALARPLGWMLDAVSIDRIVFVNNWLLATDPEPRLTSSDVRAITDRLQHLYPDSAIAFRSINPVTGASLVERLVGNGYRLVRSRRVYLLDATRDEHLKRSNLRADLTLLDQSQYEIVRCPATLETHAPRLADLYRDLYVVKHSRLNPNFNARFFELVARERLFEFVALVKDGRVDAFAAFWVHDQVMIGALIGYDRTLPRTHGLYRLIIAAMIREAGARRLVLNLSGGAGEFKMLRGAVPIEEFDAVYDRHLPAARRLAWRALASVANLGRRLRQTGE